MVRVGFVDGQCRGQWSISVEVSVGLVQDQCRISGWLVQGLVEYQCRINGWLVQGLVQYQCRGQCEVIIGVSVDCQYRGQQSISVGVSGQVSQGFVQWLKGDQCKINVVIRGELVQMISGGLVQDQCIGQCRGQQSISVEVNRV